jgi:hypothetical protein
VVKGADGYHKFYQNGTLIHTDRHSMYAGKIWPFRDVDAGEPVRLSVPMGGLIGEAWVFAREIPAAAIQSDFISKRERYDTPPRGNRYCSARRICIPPPACGKSRSPGRRGRESASACSSWQ